MRLDPGLGLGLGLASWVFPRVILRGVGANVGEGLGLSTKIGELWD